MQNRAIVLAVDDEERNLRLMESILVPAGYEVELARSGREAIEKAGLRNPDVILLDVMMPGMNGFEVCHRLQADAQTAPIPILLVTALESREDRMKGIDAGATDFISKPIDMEYLLLKVRNAIYVKNLYNTVRNNLEHQKKVEEVRCKLTDLIVRDLRMPLIGIGGALDSLKDQSRDRLEPEQLKTIGTANAMVRTMVELINSILAASHFEKGNIEVALNHDGLRDIANDTIEHLGSLRSKSNLTITCTPLCNLPIPDPELIRRVMLNLFSNAVEYTSNGDNFVIALDVEPTGLRIRITDAGRTWSDPDESDKAGVFNRNAINSERSFFWHGLGMAFCKMVVEANGGSSGIEDNLGESPVFWCYLPLKGCVEQTADEKCVLS